MADAPTDAIKERIDIVALISESLPLKRAGSNFKARCPFHEEDTPSFMVSPARQTFRCFGCSESGDVFSWLMKREGMSFPEALRVLAQRAGVPITFDRSTRGEERERLRATLDLATTFYERVLLETAEGSGPLQYLAERGLSSESIRTWRLGFCPRSGTRIQEKALERGVHADELVRSGVLGAREGRTFEFFSGRILFPLADAHGSVVGLAGRVFEGGDASTFAKASDFGELSRVADRPKYINTPETALYKKSAVLYGLERAKDAIRKENLAVLVEGYTDVILSHQAGAVNVVATAGTALTDDHLRLLRRFTDRLAFAFDADVAGDAATRRAIDLALDGEFLVSVVVLPGDQDPADLVRADPERWRRALADRRDVFAFLLERVRTRHRTETPEGQRAAAADLLPVIARVRDPVVQGHYAQQLAATLRVDPRYVDEALAALKRAAENPGQGQSEVRGTSLHSERLGPGSDALVLREERLLVLLLADPSHLARVAGILPAAAFASPQTRALYSALVAWYGSERVNRPSVGSLADFRATVPEDLRQRFDALLFAVDIEREQEAWDPAKEASGVLRSLLLGYLRRELRSRTEELQHAPVGERAERLQAVADIAAEFARAEQVTWEA